MIPPPLASVGKAEVYRADLPTKATSTAFSADDNAESTVTKRGLVAQ